ncbi:response regulator transcription factor [Aeribacillus pallidus]|uniref:DNA-binding response regulator n=1 Tax=Aeribacillus pallidus TaxID=33936 RepID=A0A223E5J0_9BACI|nr:response regulator transcription factor [Aeribacillus pallidus]ASS90385.1 DNA-binding response regulator [Aeribacillus pallidus]
MIRILVIDDHPAVREGTKAILETDSEVEVDCLEPPYTAELMEKIDFLQYDAVLMDMNLGDINGIELAKQITSQEHQCKVLLYTGYDVNDYMEEAISLGIHGVISKTESKEKILSHIRHALLGEIILSFDYVKKLIERQTFKSPSMKEANEPLTDREKMILMEVERGLTNQEIADKLHLSKRSIEYSLTSIFNKLHVSSRTEAVLIAKSEGIL